MSNRLLLAAKAVFSGKDDVENILLAESLVKKVGTWFKLHSEVLEEYGKQNSQGLWLFPIKYIDSRYKDLYLGLGKKSSNVKGGFSKTSKGSYVVLNILGDAGLQTKNLDQWISVGGSKVFIHELTHYFDSKKYKNKLDPQKKPETEEDYSEYFNSPQEWNAFWQEGVSSIIWLLERPELQEHFLKNFNMFEAFVKKQMDEEFLKALNPENKRKLQKRIYNLYQEFLARKPQKKVASGSVSLDHKIKARGEHVISELTDNYQRLVEGDLEKRKKDFSVSEWKQNFEKALNKVEDKELKETLFKEAKDILHKAVIALVDADKISDFSDEVYEMVRNHYKQNRLGDSSDRYMQYRGYITVLRDLSELLQAKAGEEPVDPFKKVKDFENFLKNRLEKTLEYLDEQSKRLVPLARELGIDLVLDANIDKDRFIDDADKHEYEPSYQVEIKGTDLSVTVFVEGNKIEVDDVLDDDDFFTKPSDHSNYDALVYFLRTGKLPKEKPLKFIKLYRGMSSVEMRHWQAGATIPVGKFFTTKATGSFAYDDPDLQKKIKENPEFSYGLEEFYARNDAVSERDSSIYITIKESKLDEKGRIVPL